MPTALTLLVALLVAAAIGASLTWFLLRVRGPRLASEAGLRNLAAMRWREFSRLVVEALRSRGYEQERPDDDAERGGQQADQLLRRDGRRWLLSCKQGRQYRVTPEVVAEVAEAVRIHGAAGGMVITPGRIDPRARINARDIELIDGNALWPMVKPLSPPGVLEELDRDAVQQTQRGLAAGWVLAVAMGLTAAWLFGPKAADSSPAAPITADAVESAPPHANPTPAMDSGPALAPAPVSDEEQRSEITRAIGTLPGIDRAVWSTRSTLLVYLDDDVDRRSAICAILERHDRLRASRLQLQPPAGSEQAVRFVQCQAF